MILATLVGIVALVWPSPQVQTVEQIATAAREPERQETPRPAMAAAKPQQPKAKAAAAPEPPPPVVKKMPAPNTTTRRAGPLLQNGLEPPMAITPPDGKAAKPAMPAARPPVPPRPPSASKSRDKNED